MQNRVLQKLTHILFVLLSFFYSNNILSQCTVTVDVANLQHINCPNGGAVGVASIIQANYLNYSWQNITNGQFYNGGGGFGGGGGGVVGGGVVGAVGGGVGGGVGLGGGVALGGELAWALAGALGWPGV